MTPQAITIQVLTRVSDQRDLAPYLITMLTDPQTPDDVVQTIIAFVQKSILRVDERQDTHDAMQTLMQSVV